VAAEREPGPGEWAVVALLAEAPAHGWSLVEKLRPGGQIGAVWSVPRPGVYRSLELLERRGLIEREGLERAARGPHRAVFRVTREGHDALGAWLADPVEHVRDIRWLFLLKLVLAARAGIDREPLIRNQLATIAPTVAALEAKLGESSDAEEIYVRFRLDATRSVVAFLEELLESDTSGATP
jgi:DNA-binding PadR family transcriptional regulator